MEPIVTPSLFSSFLSSSFVGWFTGAYASIAGSAFVAAIANSTAYAWMAGLFASIPTSWASLIAVVPACVTGHLYLFGGLIATLIGGGGLSFWWWNSPSPKVIVVEYSLLEINTLTMTFLIAVAFLIAYFLFSGSKKHRNTLLFAAAPIGFSLYVKRIVLAHKWNLNNLFDQIGLFMSGDFNSEQLIVLVFTVLLFACLFIACSAEISFVNLLMGFIFPSLDALISKSLYVVSLPLLSPFINSTPVGDVSLLSLVTSVFVAYVAFCFFILCIQILKNIFLDVKKEFYDSEFYQNMNAEMQKVY